ncbi:aldehyde-activating protein [Maritalea porphyrae]|uniref:Aldehyde-activating protein n=2 Tax=Maritalea porphyrae TaxID=880732 RepID=A0ABQ5ULC6_9HYPH|nr:aldehyde-activating protein [Maritalea porphyrae]
MANMSNVQGGCLCGDVRFETTSSPDSVGICHCLDCRKHHGALFYAAAIFKHDDVKITGETNHYKGRHFCPNCGSSVFAKTGDETEVHLGAFDQPNQFVPTYELWCARREEWLPPFVTTKQFEKEPKDKG